MSTSFGRRATSTADRAGAWFPKNFAYIPLTVAKSFMDFKKTYTKIHIRFDQGEFFWHTVVLTTFPNSEPPASTTAFRFLKTCSVCASTPPDTICIVDGSRGIHPEQKSKFPNRMPWEYGPIAAGASVTALFNRWFNIPYATVRLTRCRHDGQGFVRFRGRRHGTSSSDSSKPYLISDMWYIPRNVSPQHSESWVIYFLTLRML